jgi:hypothetical protein
MRLARAELREGREAVARYQKRKKRGDEPAWHGRWILTLNRVMVFQPQPQSRWAPDRAGSRHDPAGRPEKARLFNPAIECAPLGRLNSPGGYEQDALARCQRQPAGARAACEKRVRGTGNTTVTGSVQGAGSFAAMKCQHQRQHRHLRRRTEWGVAPWTRPLARGLQSQLAVACVYAIFAFLPCTLPTAMAFDGNGAPLPRTGDLK